jgi:hypothetical protein
MTFVSTNFIGWLFFICEYTQRGPLIHVMDIYIDICVYTNTIINATYG